MPRGSGTNELMRNMMAVAENIKRMDAIGLCKMRKFSAVVGLNHPRSIAKEDIARFTKSMVE